MLWVLLPLLGIHFAMRHVQAQSVTQPDLHVTVSEGASLELRCNYSYGSAVYLYWYVQYPTQGLQPLLRHFGSGEPLVRGIRGFEAEFKKSDSSFHLRKSSVQGSDSAVYFCAVSEDYGTGTNKLIFGTGTLLSVEPNIQDPAPAVYQLRDPKSSKNSVCLFTDFDSQVNVSHLVDSEMFISDKTVLDMKSMDSKSNGALAWSNKTDFKCTDVFTENTFTASSDISCDANLVEKSFETDMNLNFQNLSVMGLRILLLKVAGFNLLMTLRLWSS